MDHPELSEDKTQSSCVMAHLAHSTEATSTMTHTIQELKQAIDSFSIAVAKLPQAITRGVDDLDNAVAVEEEAWETVLDTMKDHDKETIESWKDELNNLLVFAGLFSAVVTAFTIESYTWLQQDPGDASNLLLARISLQLSSLTIAVANVNSTGPLLMNSSAIALSLSDISSMFVPASYAIPVNLMWMLSLTLSLVSAFFAIAVQQWLRQLRVPLDMPVHRAVQLSAFRQDGLKTWQVPSIISLLPLLLQVAVVLFLIGLFLLLRSLDTTVAVAFGAVAAMALATFLATVTIPLITTRCPYKSPIVPTTVVILQCATYPLALISTPIVFFLGLLLKGVIRVHDRTLGSSWTIVDSTLEVWGNFSNDVLLPYVRSFGRHMFVDLHQFWLSHEYQHIFSCDEDEQATLKGSSLAHTVLSTRSRRLPELLRSLGSIGTKAYMDTFRSVVVQSLCAFFPGLKWETIAARYALDMQFVPYIRGWLSTRHRQFILQLIQQRDWTEMQTVTYRDSEVLTVFHELDTAAASTSPQFVKCLINICASQQVSADCRAWETVPACLLLDAVESQRYILDEDDVAAILRISSKFLSLSNVRPEDGQFRLSSVALTLALIASCTAHTTSTRVVAEIVEVFAEYLTKDQTRDILLFGFHRYYRNPHDWSKVFPPYMSPVRIQIALCKALADYASTDTLPLDGLHLRKLAFISSLSRNLCREGFTYQGTERSEPKEAEERRELDSQEVQRLLDRLDGALATNQALLHRVNR